MQVPQPRNFFTGNLDRVFVFEHLPWEKLAAAGWNVDKEIYHSILETVGDITGTEIAPLAPLNDRAQSEITPDGKLAWPTSMRRTYQELQTAGMLGFFVEEKYGGPGLPGIMHAFYREMVAEADASLFTIVGLTDGVADLIQEFGSDELKQEYLPKMVSGTFTGSMDLTEAEAGSDLSRIRTLAEVVDENSVRISGTKRFITNGDAEVHVVLARDADAPETMKGTIRGISLYLVPWKYQDNQNGVRVTRLEEKLGIHASPTCEVMFEDARGFLLGKKGSGVYHMFSLMNNARLGVAGQALGILEAAKRDALDYARQRRQFGTEIVNHGMVKEMLAEMQLTTELVRAVIYDAALAMDFERALRNHPDRTLEQQANANRAAVLTPLIKYYATERAVSLTRTGLQVHGGVGYTTDFNAERYVRDAIITTIYEGTSEIQVSLFLKEALKGLMGMSRANPQTLCKEMYEGMKTLRTPELLELADKVQQAARQFETSLTHVGTQMMTLMSGGIKQEDAFNLLSPVAKPLANLLAETYGAYLLVQQAQHDERKKEVAHVFVHGHLIPHAAQYDAKIRSVNADTLQRYDRILT